MNIFSHIISTHHSGNEAFGDADEFVDIVAKMSQESGEEPAIILADKLSVANHIPFYNACLKKNIKPVLGIKANLIDENGFNNEFIFIAKNEEGRYNLNRIISESYKSTKEKPYKTMLLSDFIKNNIGEHLIVVSTGSSIVENFILENNIERAKEEAEKYYKIFKEDFYLSVKRVAITKEEQIKEELIIEGVKQITSDSKIKAIAFNDVRFPKKEDYESHIQRKAILNKKWPKLYAPHIKISETPNQYLIPTNSMLQLFSDFEESVINLREVVAKTENTELKAKLKKPKLPKFPIPAEFNDDSELYLRHVTDVGFEKRWQKIEEEFKQNMGNNDYRGNLITPEYIKEQRKIYEDRIESESIVIKNSGFAGYFLIIHELVQWCKANGVSVGPGRGSGAGSLVLYSLTVTNVDPIKHELLFERFLNPERISEPDVDIDFSTKKRHLVIQHMVEMYGRENTAQILTEQKQGAKSSVTNVARMFGMKPFDMDRVKDFFPDDEAVFTTIQEEMETNDKLKISYNNNISVKNVIDSAIKQQGSITAYGKHAGGVVISLGDMSQYAGLYRGDDDQPVVQMTKDLCEEIGLIKFDLLGLGNLDVIQETLDTINRDRVLKDYLLADDIPLEDPKAFALFKKADTYGVFQFESSIMRRLMARIMPETLEEVIAIIALGRPGPLEAGMSDNFVDRKHGRAPVEYPHARLSELLAPTYGTIIYQEQVMSIGRILAGFSLGQADLLRKAMGKKKPEEMAKQSAVYAEGCAKQFREEVRETTSKRLKSRYVKDKLLSIDISLEDIQIPFIKDLVKDSNGKIVKIEQITKLLHEYGGFGEETLKEFVLKNMESPVMQEMEFFKTYFPQLVSNGVNKLSNEGYSIEDAELIVSRLGIASSIFIRFNKIFTDIEKFAGYGFNKSHSAAYAYIAMQTAYLKAHYPAQYMSALLGYNKKMEDLTETANECKRIGLKIKKPNINEGFADFYPETTKKNETEIRYGLSQIKGLKSKVKGLILEREKTGIVNNILEFYDKYANNTVIEETPLDDGNVEIKKTKLMGKTVFENLLNAGALDCICPNEDPTYRTHLYKTYDTITNYDSGFIKKLKENIKGLNKSLSEDDKKEIIQAINGYIPEFKAVKFLDINTRLSNLENEQIHKLLEHVKLCTDIEIKSETFEEYLKNEKIKYTKIVTKGKEVLYVEPEANDYKKIHKIGTPECAQAELELTGIYQSTHPMNIQKEKAVMTIPESELVKMSDLKSYIENFGKKNQKDKTYANVKIAGAIIDCSYFNKEYDGNKYTEVKLTLDDGTGIAVVSVKAEELFAEGKEQRGIEMLKDKMNGREVLFVSGSASLGNYESETTNVYANTIGSGNPEFYLPLSDPSLNAYDPEVNKDLIPEKTSTTKGPKASEAQLNFLRKLLEQNSIEYNKFLEESEAENFSDLAGKYVSECINKYKDNSPKTSNGNNGTYRRPNKLNY